MKVNHLRQVAQHVEDMDRAVAFYRDVVGLDLIARFDPPGLAFFDLGTSRLLLEAGAPPALLYLGVDDVASMTEQLREAGVTIESEPHVIHVDEAGAVRSAGRSGGDVLLPRLRGQPGRTRRTPSARQLTLNLRRRPGRRQLADVIICGCRGRDAVPTASTTTPLSTTPAMSGIGSTRIFDATPLLGCWPIPMFVSVCTPDGRGCAG